MTLVQKHFCGHARIRHQITSTFALLFFFFSISDTAVAQSGVWTPKIDVPVEAHYLHKTVTSVNVYCGIYTDLTNAKNARNLNRLTQGKGLLSKVLTASMPVDPQRSVSKTLTFSFRIDRTAARRQGLTPHSVPGWRCELYVSNGKDQFAVSSDASLPAWARATDTSNLRASSTGTF